MTVKVKVGQLDIMAAGHPVWVIASPVTPSAAGAAVTVLNSMAAAGPWYRVGLRPSRLTSRWEFTRQPGTAAAMNHTMGEGMSPSDMLDCVAGNRPEAPISVGQSGEVLCLCFDHGIGDSHLMMEVLAGLSRTTSSAGFVEPLPVPNTRYPLPTAFLHTVKSDPRILVRGAARVWGAVMPAVRDHVSRTTSPTVDPWPDSKHDSERYTAVFVASPPGFISDVRAFRKAAQPEASVTGLMMLSMYRALHEGGIAVSDELEVLIDLRRFLPRDRTTFSNFTAVTRVKMGPRISAEDFSAALSAKVRSTRPMVKLAAYLMWARVLMRLRRRNSDGEPVVGGPIGVPLTTLTMSDISKMPSTSKVAWLRLTEAELAVALPPGTRSHVSIAIWVAPNEAVQVTATFFPSQVEPSLMKKSLELALSPAGLAKYNENRQPESGEIADS